MRYRKQRVYPPRHQRYQKVNADEKMHEHQHHKVERAQDPQAVMLHIPLRRAAHPVPRQSPRPPTAPARLAVVPYQRQIRHRRQPQHQHAHYHQRQQRRRRPDVRREYGNPAEKRVVRVKEPQAPPPVRQRRQYPKHRNEQQHIEQPYRRPKLSHPRHRPPPMRVGYARRYRHHRSRLRRRQHKREHHRKVAPHEPVPNPVRQPQRKPDYPQDKQYPRRRYAAPPLVAGLIVLAYQVLGYFRLRRERHIQPLARRVMSIPVVTSHALQPRCQPSSDKSPSDESLAHQTGDTRARPRARATTFATRLPPSSPP